MAFTVYILFSPSKNKYYVGQTKDLTQRIQEHNSGQSKSTKHGVPWEIVYTKNFPDRSSAMKYENKIKSMKSRKYIENLINQS